MPGVSDNRFPEGSLITPQGAHDFLVLFVCRVRPLQQQICEVGAGDEPRSDCSLKRRLLSDEERSERFGAPANAVLEIVQQSLIFGVR